MRPFFPYYGSTWNRARYLPPPQYETVVEPFAGSAGYSLFYDCQKVRLIDADPVITGLWAFLKATTPGEIMALPELPEAGDTVDNYDIPQEAKWLIGFWLNRGSAVPKKTRTAYSTRTDKAQLNWSPRAKERIATQLPILEGWTVQQGSFDEAEDAVATWLVDPPYQDKGKFYRIGFSDYPRLAQWCLARRGQTIVLEGAGADWLPFDSLGHFKTSLGKSEEKVWLS